MKHERVFDYSRRSMLRSMVSGSMLLPGIVSQVFAEDADRSTSRIRLRPSRPIFRPEQTA